MATLSHSDEHGLWMHFTTFEGPDDEFPDVTVIPMIHVANKDFLQEAYAETWRYDFALYEGAYVPMSSVFRHIYPLIAKVLGLTPQGSGKVSLRRQGWKRESEDDPRERIMVKTIQNSDLNLSRRQKQIIADMDKKGFLESVKEIPLSAKLAFPFLLIAFLLAAPFAYKRDYFFELSEDNEPEENPGFFERTIGHYFKYILEDRDTFLKQVLQREVDKSAGHDLTICVQYGQRHMKALVAFLQDELGYTQKESRPVLAVSRTRKMSLKGIQTGYGEAYAAYKSLPSNMSDEHQKYDRKMTMVENRLAAWDKVTNRKRIKRSGNQTKVKYAFPIEDVMNNWSEKAKASTHEYETSLDTEDVTRVRENEIAYSDQFETYSTDIRVSKHDYGFGYSKPGSSPDNPLTIDKDLVFVVKPKKTQPNQPAP